MNMRLAVFQVFAILCVAAFANDGVTSSPNILNVCDFGAKGDGLADDTDALQAALDLQEKCRENDVLRGCWFNDGLTAPEIYLPKGTYRITRPLIGGNVTRLRGEKGAILDGGWLEGPILYMQIAFNCRVENLHFRGAQHHVVWWTANHNAAAIVLENCLFENAREEAVFSESYQNNREPNDYQEEFSSKFKTVPEGPYAIVKNHDGKRDLRRTMYRAGLANSTRFTMRHCGFRNCGAAWRGGTDHQCLSDLRFVSNRVQILPVFRASGEFELSDTVIKAALPAGYPFGWIEHVGNATLVRVRAESTGEGGAPLVAFTGTSRKENTWQYTIRQQWLQDCSASVANSPDGALVVYRRWPLSLVKITGCRETNGKHVKAFAFRRPVGTLEELQDCGQFCDGQLPAEKAFRCAFDGNGGEIELNLPELMCAGLEKGLPEKAYAGFPALDHVFATPNEGPFDVVDAADFGLGYASGGGDETALVEKVFAAAAERANPLVLLPGRTMRVSRTIEIPGRITIKAAGGALFKAIGKIDFFKIRGEEVSIAVDGVNFAEGERIFAFEGRGRIYFKDGAMSRCRGVELIAKGGALAFDMIDSSVFGAYFIKNEGAAVRVRDSWFQFEMQKADFTEVPYYPNFIVNRGGTVLLEHVCGVPVTCNNNLSREPPKGFPADKKVAWIRNEDGGVVRASSVRFGGEFGGFTTFDNYGNGKVLVEKQVNAFYNFGSTMSMFRNESPRAKVVIDHVKMAADNMSRVAIGRGAKPGEFYVLGDRFGVYDWK